MTRSIDRLRIASVLGLLLAAGLVAGCDKDKTQDAAAKAGAGVEKAVNAVGDASRDAAHTVGGAVEKAGDKLQSAADSPSTRPVETPPR